MAGVYKGLKIELGANKAPLENALRSVGNKAKGLQRELNGIEKSLKFDSRSPEMLRQKMQKVGEQVKNTEQRLEYLRKAIQENAAEDISTEQWVELQGEIAQCEAKIKAYNAQLKEMAAIQAANSSGLGKMGNFLSDNAATFEKVGGGMQKVGGLLTRTVTPAIIGGAAASVKAAVDIDTALTGVRKTVDGTEEQYQQLKEAAIEFSKVNATSATDFLDAQAMGAQLGFAIDELQRFAEVATGLDIATNMDLETAGTEMARFANITKMSHDDIENYASAIVNVGNNMATTESEVSALAMRLAASGTQVGMSQADIIGLAGALSSLGVEAEAGGTAVSTIMANIDKAVASGGEDLETWASTAKMSADEFASAWEKKPVDALAAVLSGMEDATEEGSNMSLMLEELGISSLRQTDVMKRMAGNSELMAEGVKIANDGWRENTALSNEVANRNDSLAAKFEMLKNRIIAVAEEVGVPVADAMLEAVDAAEPLFEAIESGARAFSEMSKEEQQAVLQTVGFLAVLGPMTTGIGRVISNIGGMGEGMVKLAQGFAKVDMIGLANDSKKAAESAAAASKAVTGMGTAAKGASVAMGALKTAGVLALVAGIALTISMAKDYYDHMKKVEKATDGVRDAMQGSFSGSAKAAFEEATGGAESYGKSLHELRDQHEKVLEANTKLADSIKDTYDELGDKNSVIDNFRESLDKLESTAEPTEHQLADMKIAIEQMNETFGTSFELAQNADGSYTAITSEAAEAARQIDELRAGLGENAQLTEDQLAQLQEDVQRINEEFGTTYEVSGSAEEGYQIVGAAADGAREKVDKLLASLKAQNAYEAFSGLAKESSAALQEASANLADVQMQHAAAKEYLAEANANYNAETEEGLGQVLAAEAAVRELEQQLGEAQGAYDAAAEAAGTFASAQNLMMQATEDNSSALTQAIAGNDLLINSFVSAGKDVSAFKDTLEAAGVSAEDIAGIGADGAAALARAYKGNFSDIESTLATFGIDVDEQAKNAVKAAEENEAAAAQIEQAWRDAFSVEGVDWDELTESLGTSVRDLSQEMKDAGVSFDDFSNIGATGFARLYKASNGNLQNIIDQVTRLNDIGINEKSFEVTDDGTIVDTYGNIIDLDAMTVGDKPFVVTGDGSIEIVTDEITDLDSMEIEDKSFKINDDGTITFTDKELNRLNLVRIDGKNFRVDADTKNANKNLEETGEASDKVGSKKPIVIVSANTDNAISGINTVENKSLSNKTTNLYANDYASGTIDRINRMSLADKVVNIFENVRRSVLGGGNASGGVIPQHMAGGIFTSATLTNVGWVGEAGAEAWLQGPGNSSAIVPLSNRRYVRPFAQAVASEITTSGRGSVVNNYQVNLAYDAGEDASTIARDLARELQYRTRMEA